MKERSTKFLEELRQRVFVCDGAMGTMLYSKGVPANRCFEELNDSMPSLIKEVHDAYIRAGAEIIETNTFGANAVRLSAHGLSEKCQEFNRAGVRLARKCAGDKVLVAGAVGPLGVRLEPLGPCPLEQARRAFEEQIQALAEAGADLIMLETFYDLNEIREAIAAVRDVCDLPLIAQVTITDDGNMVSGTAPEQFTRQLMEWGADAVGCNCSVGPQAMLAAVQRMSGATNLPLTAQPNAGLPVNVGGRNMYLCSPEYMAGYIQQFIRCGVKLAGGCCGTTPEHIRAIRDAVSAVQAPRPRVSLAAVPDVVRTLQPVPLSQRSRLAAKVATREFIALAEILPPRGCDATKEIEGARYLAENGVDAIFVPDSPRAGARMSAQAMAHLVQDRAGIEALLQYSCRNRNIVGIQSDLLGGYGLGLRNLLLTTGDAPPSGNYPDATAVFDVDAIGLTKIVGQLNQGLDIGGNFLGNQTGFLIAVVADPGAVNFEQEMERLRSKLRVGAECVVTRPVFDIEKLVHFLDAVAPFNMPVILTIWPLTSHRHAEYLANELHMAFPESVLQRMRAADSGELARSEGVRIAQEMARSAKDRVQGLLVGAPLGRYETVVEVFGAVRGEQRVASSE
ncbi:MAG: bifunctional homocysteine S-methyltransferase/methylenetetrahydrofolate reductase [Acidobacteria bacterium]|nr:bifunctional homocysteine S-methyltransferase/methylenetetrahydrofolate reductase [Acidobacteriota bacterium]